jgi:excinuclease ABC subunit B
VPVDLDDVEEYSPAMIGQTVQRLELQMREAAANYEFERAAELRDKIKVLRNREIGIG